MEGASRCNDCQASMAENRPVGSPTSNGHCRDLQIKALEKSWALNPFLYCFEQVSQSGCPERGKPMKCFIHSISRRPAVHARKPAAVLWSPGCRGSASGARLVRLPTTLWKHCEGSKRAAAPKSAMRIVSSLLIRTLSHLMSRCATPTEWMNDTPHLR